MPSAKRLSLTAAIPAILLFSSAPAWPADPASGPTFHFHESDILGTSLDLTIIAPKSDDAQTARTAVLADIERLRKILSTYDPATDLSRVNATLAPVKVPPEVIQLLRQYEQWAAKSNGALSTRIGVFIDAWKQAEKSGKPPEKSALQKLAADSKKPLWKIDETAGTVQRLADIPINIDSLGKGFIISHAAELAAKPPGVRGILLNIGGDITAVGTSSPTGIDPWTVGVADPAHPADNAPPLAWLKLTGKSIATSGNYERGYQFANTHLSHILDPRTGYPVDSPDAPGGRHSPQIASATVIAPDNTTANALATSLCVLSPDAGLALINQTPGTEALLILADGSQKRSAGFSRYETISPALASKGWPSGYQLTVPLQLNGAARERPYVAVWIEDATGRYVTTLAEWGDSPKYLSSLSTWERSISNPNQIRQVSRATRPAGRYALTWDGKDFSGKTVQPGSYKVFVEVSYEHNGHSVSSSNILCGDAKTTATITRTQHFDDISLVYASRGS